MPKYRLLSIEELEALKDEFIGFLIINGISAQDWDQMKLTMKDESENILELFSDTILESVLRKTNFIEVRSKDKISIIRFLSGNQVLVGIEVPDSLGVDFTDPDSYNKAVDSDFHGVKVFTATKQYIKTREFEIFELLQMGGLITDDRLFKLFCLML